MLLASSLKGQDPYHLIFNSNDGLPSSELYDVEVDSKGRIWIASDRGVSVYNGYEFKNYTVLDGLASNTVFEIFIDNNDIVLLASFDRSITIFQDGKFSIPTFNDKIKELGKGSYIDYIEQYDSISYTITWKHRKFQQKGKRYRIFPFHDSIIKCESLNYSEDGVIPLESEESTIFYDPYIECYLDKTIKDELSGNLFYVRDRNDYYYYDSKKYNFFVPKNIRSSLYKYHPDKNDDLLLHLQDNGDSRNSTQ